MKIKVLYFVILMAIWIFLPLLPTSSFTQCVTVPCNSLIFFSMLDFFRYPIDNVEWWTYIALGVEIFLLYGIAAMLTRILHH